MITTTISPDRTAWDKWPSPDWKTMKCTLQGSLDRVVAQRRHCRESGKSEASADDFLELAAYGRMDPARETPIRDYPQNR